MVEAIEQIRAWMTKYINAEAGCRFAEMALICAKITLSKTEPNTIEYENANADFVFALSKLDEQQRLSGIAKQKLDELNDNFFHSDSAREKYFAMFAAIFPS
jgi:hypothetical protein